VAGAALATVAAFGTTPGNALTMKECSAKYRAAKSAATAATMSWQDFRKAYCDASAYAPAESTPSARRGIAFPKAISPKYSKGSAGKARLHTCLDQYNANKATNSNGGLRWIQRGGGYYSACDKRLKG
jgi:hypothetical protein